MINTPPETGEKKPEEEIKNRTIKYHVWYEEQDFRCTVEDNNNGYDNFNDAVKIFESKKEISDWVQLEKVTSEIINTYSEPYPFNYGDKVRVIKEGLLYNAEGVVWKYNKSYGDVTILFEQDNIKVDFEPRFIVKI